jgi:RNA polymerase sigma-70 factor, ECF subfamily
VSITESVTVAEFLPLAEPYRRELLAHCYRMLGSLHDAEDLVQETYLRAWRAYDGFEGRSSLRTWLYRIATNACLTALEGQSRSPLPSGLADSPADPDDDLAERSEVPWLQPIPDRLVGAWSADPAVIVAARQSLRLAFIAALQYLPARQRAVLVLREVLNWRAAEVADLLGTSAAAVNSMLQRARAQISLAAPEQDAVSEPETLAQRQLLDRYVAAFEDYDIGTLVELFSSDVVWDMPPYAGWYRGPQAIARLIASKCPVKRAGDLRLLPTRANGQQACAMYLRNDAGLYEAFQLHVLHVSGSVVDHVAAFIDVSLFAAFGLPVILPASSG